MDIFLNLLYAVFVLGVLGGLFGLILTLTGDSEPKNGHEAHLKLLHALPGLDCGVCGYVTCAAYAAALTEGSASVKLCLPGGENGQKKLAKVMGLEVSYTEESLFPQVHCRGGRDTAAYLFAYQGLDDCSALYLLYEGDKACKYGCLGLGSCMKVCPGSAIAYDEQGLVRVDKDRCTNCGLCVEVCPTGVLRMIPRSADVIVACNSPEKGTVTEEQCSVGCTACRACEKRSPEGGFSVEKNLAKINYRRRGERLNALMSCPTGCIIKNRGAGGESVTADPEAHA